MSAFEEKVHSRFKGASWYKHKQIVVIGGAGGIGSWLSLFLARQGHELHIYDFDEVEEHNIGGQFYSTRAIGSLKVDALRAQIMDLCSADISVYDHKYTTEVGSTAPVMAACFDNMAARMTMFKKWKHALQIHKDAGYHCIFVDGRLNAETADIFCVTDEKSQERWLSEWFDDSKVEDAPCTFKATSHCAAILAGIMTACINNFTANSMEDEQRSVPFKTSIWLPTMTVQTEDI